MVVTDPLPERRERLRPALADAAQGQESRTMPITIDTIHTFGTEGHDELQNDPDLAHETIHALGGNDIIRVRSSNVAGSPPTIVIEAGDGDDVVDVNNESAITVYAEGGNGNDIIIAKPIAGSYITGLSSAEIFLTKPDLSNAADINYSQMERLEVEGTADTLSGSQISWTTGDTHDKITVLGTRGELPIAISTGGGDDKIYLNGLVGNGSSVSAGDGNDFVRGSSRNDTLEGGAGEDTLEGGDGNDVLTGGGGRDVMLGGAGSDVFKYTSVQDSYSAGIDTIGDFVRGVDKIDLSAIGGLHWVLGAFTETPGEVRASLNGFQVDVDGDAVADMIVFAYTGWGGLKASDFIF